MKIIPYSSKTWRDSASDKTKFAGSDKFKDGNTTTAWKVWKYKDELCSPLPSVVN